MRTVLQMIPLHCQKPINFLIFKHDNRKTKNQKEVQNFLNPVTIAIIAAVAAAVVFGVVGFVLGEVHRKKVAESAIGSATEEATRIVNQAVQTAENKKREAILEAKDEIHSLRSEAEKENRERRAEVQRQERRIIQKEESLDKKTEALEAKEEALNEKVKTADKKLEEVEKIKKSQFDMLEKISGYTKEQAKTLLLQNLDEELTHDKAVKIMDFEQRTKDEQDALAREIISTAIQRCAADQAAEATVSVVTLPNDEMKGRIIGREGRNIRTLETITGVDLIIDDTPEAITVSSFEPVRREIARLTIEKLISDGRIHPARIEEMYEKSKREVEQTIRQTGERAVVDAGVNGIHPELVKILGKLKYRTSYGQNVLNHSLEVSYIAGLMAAELGADVKTAKRAGLLHDIKKEETPNAMKSQAILSNMDVSDEELYTPALWHGPAGAYHISKNLGIKDNDILNAVRYHTAGRADMSLLEKIVYLGDLTSADRSYKDVEKYREMSFENLDNAMYNALKYSIGETLGKGGVIPPCTIAGYNFYTKLMRARKSETERKNPKND